jgi:predicted dinucleotide-binding enzyme
MILVHAEVVKNTSSATVNSEMKIPPSISIVGTGNVAEVLGQRLIDAKLNVVSIIGRNESRTQHLSTKWGCAIESFENITGDLILVAVSDEATISIVDALNINKLVAITSG